MTAHRRGAAALNELRIAVPRGSLFLETLDLLQEVYVHAFRSLGRYRGEGSLEAWLAVMAIRRARDCAKSQLVAAARQGAHRRANRATTARTGPLA